MKMILHIFVLNLLMTLTPTLAIRSSGCGQAMPDVAENGKAERYFIQVEDPTQGTLVRSYLLHVPKNYNIEHDIPMVVNVHGWTMTAEGMNDYSKFPDVADEDDEGFFVLSPDGMSDNLDDGHWWGSFNCSRTDGPMGVICDTERSKWEEYPCYSSCSTCDPTNSCDWTSCYDDIFYTRLIMEDVMANFCINQNSIHMSGISNGAQFTYYMISQLSEYFATIAPVAGAPMIGFGELPPVPVSLIDFHGLFDETIPNNMEYAQGRGPHDSLIANDGFYYEEKVSVLSKYYNFLECDELPTAWETSMDGVAGWSCQIWDNCKDGHQVVGCTGEYTHQFPFDDQDMVINGTRILWNFMKNHPKQDLM